MSQRFEKEDEVIAVVGRILAILEKSHPVSSRVLHHRLAVIKANPSHAEAELMAIPSESSPPKELSAVCQDVPASPPLDAPPSLASQSLPSSQIIVEQPSPLLDPSHTIFPASKASTVIQTEPDPLLQLIATPSHSLDAPSISNSPATNPLPSPSHSQTQVVSSSSASSLPAFSSSHPLPDSSCTQTQHAQQSLPATPSPAVTANGDTT